MKISIIIPIFNTDKHNLLVMLDSVRNQTFTDYECILVDDGSEPATLDVLDGYASDDSRFRVVRAAHGGCFAARNVGLEYAQGEYIYLCDSDDYLRHDALEALIYWIEKTNADSVCGDTIFAEDPDEGIFQASSRDYRQCAVIVDDIAARLYMADMKGHFSGPSIPAKLFRASAIKGARYADGDQFFEDGRFLIKLCCAFLGRAAIVRFPVYAVRTGAESLTRDGRNAAWYFDRFVSGISPIPEMAEYKNASQNMCGIVQRWVANLVLKALKVAVRDFARDDAVKILAAVDAAIKKGGFVPRRLTLDKRFRYWRYLRRLKKRV